MLSNGLQVVSAVLMLSLAVDVQHEAHAYDRVRITNSSPYGGVFRVLYAGCAHDDGQIAAPSMVKGTVLDKDKKKNPPPEVIEEARRRATPRNSIGAAMYEANARAFMDPYYFYQPQKPALVFKVSLSQVQADRGGCLITTIRATLYDSQNHKSIEVSDYLSSGTGFSDFVIQQKFGVPGEYELVSTDKWWMPLVPGPICWGYAFSRQMIDLLGQGDALDRVNQQTGFADVCKDG